MDDNYGWPLPLEFDEYPTEIQCSSCFLYVLPDSFITFMSQLEQTDVQVRTGEQMGRYVGVCYLTHLTFARSANVEK